MSKNFFDEKDIVEEPKSFFDDNDVVQEEPEKIGKLQAAAVGAIDILPQPVTNVVAGIGGELSRLAENKADELFGIKNVDEQLKKQGFQIVEPERKNAYVEGVETIKNLQKKASEDQPLAYYGASIPASIVGGGAILKTAGKSDKLAKLLGTFKSMKDASKTARIGAAGLTATGLGAAESVTSGKSPEEIASDIATSAGIGTAIGAGAEALGGTGRLVKKGVEKFKDSDMGLIVKREVEGLSLLAKESIGRLEGDAKKQAKKITDSLFSKRKSSGKEIGDLMEEAGEKGYLGDMQQFVQEVEEKAKPIVAELKEYGRGQSGDNSETKKALNKVKEILNRFSTLKGKLIETTEKQQMVKGVKKTPVYGPPTVVQRGPSSLYSSPAEEAQAKLLQKQQGIEAKARELGKDVSAFEPTVQKDLDQVSQLVETIGDKGTTKQVITQPFKYGQQTPVEINYPKLGTKFSPKTVEMEIEKATREPFSENSGRKLQKIRSVLGSQLEKITASSNPEEHALYVQMINKIDEKISELPKQMLNKLKSSRKEFEQAMVTGQELGLENTIRTAIPEIIDPGEYSEAKKKAVNEVYKLAENILEKEKKGFAKRGQMDETIKNIYEPLTGEKGTLDKINQLSREYQIAKEMNLPIKSQITPGASLITQLSSVSGITAKRAAAKTLATGAKIAKGTGDYARQLGTKITNKLPIEKVQALHQRAMANPKYSEFANALQRVVNEPDVSKRNVLMYGLYQQPAFREFIGTESSIIDDEE